MMRITTSSQDLIGKHNANSDLIWLTLPLPLVLLGTILSDVVVTPVQTLLLLAFSTALIFIVATKIEWTTLHLERPSQRARIRRKTLLGIKKHDLPLSEIIKARPDTFYHETGSKSHRLILEVFSADKGKGYSQIPLVNLAQGWDAQAVADEINNWLLQYRSNAKSHFEAERH